ncbi:TetR/AcrR family transcriptional repressor of nem operon [Pedobacter cryoconitis]|uniref:TetR/AcrR family transcriptional repressor of nem operon n=1 Tax=Pedobacter cryoconitis TaxID=188932 RepID=A0A7W8YXL5_9SPHI|nr:TetR/AcrR family transcriptional regulator [Pedobacter cryoconitis]MBB5623688.1 TetR/AcrR family transcriptional repressor of nem operon [Pedobacter cryoconitis]
MKGRPVTFDNEEVILKAQKVFWEKGYTATSLADLLTATGMGSGSFYNTFKGGKKELFQKAIQQRREAFIQFKAELSSSDSPIDLIKDFFRSMATADQQTHLQGCLISNTVTEMTFIDNGLENQAITILKDVEKMFALAIEKGQQDGRIKNQTDPVILGRYLITFWNGLNVTRRMYPDNKVLQKQIEMQLDLIS